MRIPENIKQDIQSYASANIVSIIGGYLQLKPSGQGNLAACCPFHGEKTPSFSVSPSRGTWHCFGSCSEGGDAAKFIMKIEGVNFNDALLKLAALGSIGIPSAGETKEEKEKKAIFSALAKADKFYRESLAVDGNEGKKYVETRMTPEMAESFGIGFAPKNDGKALLNHLKKIGVTEDIAEKAGLIRKDEKKAEYRDVFWGGRIIFPIRNKNGYTIGFAGRRMDSESRFKYVNSPETPTYKKHSALFGLDKLETTSGEVFVVEGYLDLMQMHEVGIRNVVAACGTAFTKEHLLALKKLGIRRLNLMFDGDSAGTKATQHAVFLACKEEIAVQVCCLPDGEDPDSYFKHGGKLEDVQAMSGLDFLEQSGVELDGMMRELHRLERMERALVYFAQHIPSVAGVLKKRGNLEQLFSPEALSQLQGVI